MVEGGSALQPSASPVQNGFFPRLRAARRSGCGIYFGKFRAHGFRRDAQPQRGFLRVRVNQDGVAGFVNGLGHARKIASRPLSW